MKEELIIHSTKGIFLIINEAYSSDSMKNKIAIVTNVKDEHSILT